jgi:hypothetical protein
MQGQGAGWRALVLRRVSVSACVTGLAARRGARPRKQDPSIAAPSAVPGGETPVHDCEPRCPGMQPATPPRTRSDS